MATKATKGRKIEGAAKIADIYSYLPATGPQWEVPAVKFQIGGETFRWITDEHTARGLSVGMTVNLRAFARENGRLYRVAITPAKTAAISCMNCGQDLHDGLPCLEHRVIEKRNNDLAHLTAISCTRCEKELRPLGVASVMCNCASFMWGMSDINATDERGQMIFGGWPVTMADLLAISRVGGAK